MSGLIPGFTAGEAPSPFVRELPFTDESQVADLAVDWLRDGVSVVRDAIFGALAVVLNRWTSDCAADAAATSPAFAGGTALDIVNRRVLARQSGESDDSFRARRIRPDSAATPSAMLAAIDAILEPFGYAKVAYYFESPDDEIFFYTAAENDVSVTGEITGSLDGWYMDIDGVGAIEASERLYDIRPRSRPLHGMTFGLFGDPTNTRRLGALAGADYKDAFCAWGHTIFAIPPFPLPGDADASDFFIVASPATTVDTAGNLTADALDLVANGPEFYSEATEEADDTIGNALFEGAHETSLVVSTIAAMLDERMDFPSQFTILLDQELS